MQQQLQLTLCYFKHKIYNITIKALGNFIIQTQKLLKLQQHICTIIYKLRRYYACLKETQHLINSAYSCK